MPATRRKQSNAMLYTLIIFVGLFIVATTVAVFFYVKAEDYRTSSEAAQETLNQFAKDSERQDVGALVGAQKGVSSSYLGTMIEYLDDAMVLIKGGAPEATSAEVKINNVKTQAAGTIKLTEPYIGNSDPNMTGLIQIISRLSQKLQDTIDARDKLQKTIEDKVAEFGKTLEVNNEEYQQLLQDKVNLMTDYNDIRAKYDDLSEYLKETTDEQVKTLQNQLDREEANVKTLTAQLNESLAKLSDANDLLANAEAKLAEYTGEPKRDSMAYLPDGEILSADNDAKIAYISLGSNDHVYQGLTFAIYDKGAYIGEKDSDKAEIEIFDISDSYSAARIIKSGINRPIMKGDIAANLVWDKRKTNEFVIAGDFDLNEDGKIDSDAISKIKAVIEQWGGKVTDKISIDTDYLILGKKPSVTEKPSLEEQERDPTALQRYESNLDNFNRYNSLEDRAKTLWIPIFTYEKFIHLIGYQKKLGQAGSF